MYHRELLVQRVVRVGEASVEAEPVLLRDGIAVHRRDEALEVALLMKRERETKVH